MKSKRRWSPGACGYGEEGLRKHKRRKHKRRRSFWPRRIDIDEAQEKTECWGALATARWKCLRQFLLSSDTGVKDLSTHIVNVRTILRSTVQLRKGMSPEAFCAGRRP